MLIIAFALQCWFLGRRGMVSASAGMAIGFLLFLPFYLVKGFGAGDVKLMAACGSFLGPMNTLLAVGFSLAIGSLIGMMILIVRRGGGDWLRRYGMLARTLAISGQFIYHPPAANEVAAQRFPFAVAIAAGTVATLAWVDLLYFDNLRMLATQHFTSGGSAS